MRGEAAPARRDVERGPAELPAGAVEDRVRARPARRIEYPLGPVRLGVVDDDLGAQPPDEVELAPAAGRGDDPPPGRVHELHEEDAETAARRQDEDPFAAPDPGVVDEAERGGAVVQDGGRDAQVEPVGDRDDRVGGHDGPLDVPAVGDHAPPEPSGIHIVAGEAHDSGDAVARHVRRLHREVLTPPTPTDLRVDEQGVGDRDVDDDLPRSRDRLGGRARRQHLRTAELRCDYLAHLLTSSLSESRRCGRMPTRETCAPAFP